MPPISQEGIVALGGDLEPQSLLLAYKQGIFPWPHEGYPLTWFCPPERAILEFTALHIPKSLKKLQRKHPYEITIDKNFTQVIYNCATVSRPEQAGTWITDEMRHAYTELHHQGHAHSIEVWQQSKLIGGLYGVSAYGTFAGESMFSLAPNASKLALLFLIDHLKRRGLTWMDIQVMTPHMEALGAKLIPRNVFLKKLRQTQKLGLTLFDLS